MMLVTLAVAAWVGLVSTERPSDEEQERPPVVVAAIDYTGTPSYEGEFECEETYPDDYAACEVEHLVRLAALEGAQLVVTSEYAFELYEGEPQGRVGKRPRRRGSPIQRRFSELADELDLYLVLAIPTRVRGREYSSQVVFDPDGRIVAVHHKIELYEDERDDYEGGRDITTFETPFGRVGLLLCSDLYMDPRLHQRMIDKGARIVALSSLWTVADARRWQAAFAHDWGVYLIAANGGAAIGAGGGVYGPTGHTLISSDSGYDEALVATLP